MMLKKRVMSLAPTWVLQTLREARTTAYRVLAPAEELLGIATPDNPPTYLKRVIGDPKNFAKGGPFADFLVREGGLARDEDVVDIGCGCGSIAFPLMKHIGQEGSYCGLDVYAPAIAWCTKNITSRYPRFTFRHVSVNNPIYNAAGEAARTSTLPLSDSSADLVFLRSVFTHMNADEVFNYLKEIARVLRPGGRCIPTFFLLNPEQERLSAAGAAKLSFAYGTREWRYVYESSPYTACAQDEAMLLRMSAEAGLAVRSVLYGSWSGRESPTAPELQDCMVLVKAPR
jgi:ubiquinone/menaquinone biosynthesis C-methylase UbiE